MPHQQGGCLKSETLTRCWLQRNVTGRLSQPRFATALCLTVTRHKDAGALRERGGESRFFFPLRMSINAMTAVFRLDLAPARKWILMCLADTADPYGGSIFPTIATLSQKSSVPERTLQRHLKSLVDDGWLEVVKTARRPTADQKGRGTEYRLAFMTAPTKTAPAPNYKACPKALRLEVIAVFEQTCTYCGRRGDEKDPDGKPWEVDRMLPGSRGGNYTPENVTLACHACNHRKSANLAPNGFPSLSAKKQLMGASEFDMGANLPGMGAKAVTPDPSLEPPSDPPRDPKTSRGDAGTRIPEPFLLTNEMRTWAREETPDVDLVKGTKEFVDYWRGKPGRDGKKLDWEATWRNRMRELQRRFERDRPRGPRVTKGEASIDAARQAAEQFRNGATT